MNELERDELIRTLSEEFRAFGQPELADEESYGLETPDGRLRPDPRKQLMLMLEAFERTVALEDAATFRKATLLISESTGGAVPEVRIVPLTRAGADAVPIPFDLAEVEDIRADTRRLIAEILEDDNSTDPDKDSDEGDPQSWPG